MYGNTHNRVPYPPPHPFPYDNYMFRSQNPETPRPSHIHHDYARFRYWKENFMNCPPHKCFYGQCVCISRTSACTGMCRGCCCRSEPHRNFVCNMTPHTYNPPSLPAAKGQEPTSTNTSGSAWGTDCSNKCSEFVSEVPVSSSPTCEVPSSSTQYPGNMGRDYCSDVSFKDSWGIVGNRTPSVNYQEQIMGVDSSSNTKGAQSDGGMFHLHDQMEPSSTSSSVLNAPTSSSDTKGIQCDMRNTREIPENSGGRIPYCLEPNEFRYEAMPVNNQVDCHSSDMKVITCFGYCDGGMSSNANEQSRIYTCDDCGECLPNRTAFIKHLRFHNVEEMQTCVDFEQPVKTNNFCPQGGSPYICNVCGRAFLLKKIFCRHMKSHSNVEPHTCDSCGKIVSSEKGIKEHSGVNSGETLHACHVCGKTFSKQGCLDAHLNVHIRRKSFTCDVCGDTFIHRANIVEHMSVHSDDVSHICDTCGITFAEKEDLDEHSKSHEGVKPFACNICGKTFTHNATLVVHSRIHSGEKPYSCKECGKSFSQKSALNSHVRLHTGEKPYSCTMCDKRFTVKGSLTVHMRKHTGEKPYLCKVCGKRFSQKSSLNSHSRCHTEEKQFSCHTCGKSFAERADLLEHSQEHCE